MAAGLFQPVANTFVVWGETTPLLGVLATGPTNGPLMAYRMRNVDTDQAWIAYGATPAAAQAAATLPSDSAIGSKGVTANSDAFCMPIGGGQEVTVMAPPGQYWSAVTQQGGARVQITPGFQSNP